MSAVAKEYGSKRMAKEYGSNRITFGVSFPRIMLWTSFCHPVWDFSFYLSRNHKQLTDRGSFQFCQFGTRYSYLTLVQNFHGTILLQHIYLWLIFARFITWNTWKTGRHNSFKWWRGRLYSFINMWGLKNSIALPESACPRAGRNRWCEQMDMKKKLWFKSI